MAASTFSAASLAKALKIILFWAPATGRPKHLPQGQVPIALAGRDRANLNSSDLKKNRLSQPETSSKSVYRPRVFEDAVHAFEAKLFIEDEHRVVLMILCGDVAHIAAL